MAAEAGAPRIDFPGEQRHGSDRAPDRAFAGAEFFRALGDALNQLEGAYSLLVLTPDELYAVRDPRDSGRWCWKDSVHGKRDAWLVASETCAFDLLNAQYVRKFNRRDAADFAIGVGVHPLQPPKPHQYCIFEHVYFSRPDSIIFGRSVNESREMLGRLLARNIRWKRI